MSYQTIADETGISTGTLSHIGTGRTRQPDPETLRRLARYFGEGDTARAAVIYEEFMDRAGYLDALPQMSEQEILERLRRDYPEIYEEIVGGTSEPD